MKKIIRLLALFDKNIYKEIIQLIQKREFSLKRIIRLFIYVSRSHYEAKKIKKFLKEVGLYNSSERGVIYSYRFEYQPYVGLLIKKKLPGFKIVARGHGYDLYEERNNEKYIPMRLVLMSSLDKIFMISNDGKKYLTKKYPAYKDKIIVSRLANQ